jgi:hypothetical protein
MSILYSFIQVLSIILASSALSSIRMGVRLAFITVS